MTIWTKLRWWMKYRTWPQVFDASEVEWTTVQMGQLDTMSVWVDDGRNEDDRA